MVCLYLFGSFDIRERKDNLGNRQKRQVLLSFPKCATIAALGEASKKSKQFEKPKGGTQIKNLFGMSIRDEYLALHNGHL